MRLIWKIIIFYLRRYSIPDIWTRWLRHARIDAPVFSQSVKNSSSLQGETAKPSRFLFSNPIWVILLGCIAIFFASCSSTKGLEKGQQLYMGATINLRNIGDSSLIKHNTELQEELNALLRPMPNGTLLGMPVKLWIYNWGGPTSKKGFFPNLFHKIGTPPVVATYGALQKNREILQTGWKTKAISGIR